MTEPIRCPRCRRAFGGHFTWGNEALEHVEMAT
jgi:hypothetical protein